MLFLISGITGILSNPLYKINDFAIFMETILYLIRCISMYIMTSDITLKDEE